jgi:hypothetical protein
MVLFLHAGISTALSTSTYVNVSRALQPEYLECSSLSAFRFPNNLPD